MGIDSELSARLDGSDNPMALPPRSSHRLRQQGLTETILNRVARSVSAVSILTLGRRWTEMKRRFTQEQIAFALRQAEGGTLFAPLAELLIKNLVQEFIFYLAVYLARRQRIWPPRAQ